MNTVNAHTPAAAQKKMCAMLAPPPCGPGHWLRTQRPLQPIPPLPQRKFRARSTPHEILRPRESDRVRSGCSLTSSFLGEPGRYRSVPGGGPRRMGGGGGNGPAQP